MGLRELISRIRKSDDWRKWFWSSSATSLGDSTIVLPDDFYELYSRVLWAFLGISTTAQAAALIPMKINMISDDGKAKTPLVNHPLLKLLNKPNNIDTRFSLMWKLYSFILLTGNAFWLLDRAENPTKIETIRPDRVTVSTKAGKRVYAVRNNNIEDPVEYPDDRMVQFFTFNPKDSLVGVGNMTPAQDSAVIELYLLKYDRTYFENAISPSEYIRLPDGVFVDDRTLARLKNEILGEHEGVSKFHKLMVMQGGAEIEQRRNPNHVDTDYIRHKMLVREEILVSFGCFPLAALLRDTTNKAVLQEATRMFYDFTLMPMIENVRQLINKEFLPRYPKSEMMDIEFTPQLLKNLRSDLLDISQAAYRFVSLGVLTPNEVRSLLLSLDSVPWGDQPPKTALYQLPNTLFEPNDAKEILEPDERPETAVENWLETSGALDELRRLVAMG